MDAKTYAINMIKTMMTDCVMFHNYMDDAKWHRGDCAVNTIYADKLRDLISDLES